MEVVDVSSSGQRKSGRKDLEQSLRKADGESPEVVRGVLSSLFEQLPKALQDKKLEQVLYDQDMCYVQVLQEVTKEELRQVGLSVGAAALVLKVIFPEGAELEVVGVSAVNATQVRPVLRPFPALEQTGWPAVRGWAVYARALIAYVYPQVGQEVADLMAAELEKGAAALPPRWVRGCFADRVIHGALVNQGAGSMPDDLVLLLPEGDVADQAGFAEFAFLNAKVNCVCDEAVGHRQKAFTEFPAVEENAKHGLAKRLQEWKALRSWLDANGSTQSRVQSSLSLQGLVAKLPEAREAMRALEARYVGKETPLDERLTLVEVLAVKYTAMHTPGKAAFSAGQVAKESGICYHWASGKCTKGAKCRWKHVGKPGAQSPEVTGTQNRYRLTVSQNRYRLNMSNLEGGEKGSNWKVLGRSGSKGSRKESRSPVRLENGFSVLSEVVLGSESISSKVLSDPVGVPAPRPRSVADQVAEQCNAWLAAKVAGVSECLGVDPGVAELLVLQELRLSTDQAHLGLVQGAGSYGLSNKNSKSGYGFDNDNNCIRPQDQPVGRVSARTVKPSPRGSQEGLEPLLPGPTTVLPTPEPLNEALSGGQGGSEVSQSQSKPGGVTPQPVVCQPGIPVMINDENMEGKVGFSESACMHGVSKPSSMLGPSGALVANENISKCKFSYEACVFGVIADTGATVRVIGGPDCSKAVNVGHLKEGVSVETAHGRVVVNRVGDLPGYGGLMEKCLMMPDSSQSLMPVNVVWANPQSLTKQNLTKQNLTKLRNDQMANRAESQSADSQGGLALV